MKQKFNVLQSKSMHLLLAVILAASFFLSSVGAAAGQTPELGPQDPAELSAYMDGVMKTAMEANHVPGAVVVVVKDGQVFFAEGYGYADLETQTPVSPQTTLFRPGSVSKLFTWTAVMQLVETGALDLDADVNTYLDFEIPATFEEPITLRHLLTHTAGFEDNGNGLFKLEAEEVSSLETYVKTYLPTRVFPPGQFGAYSNYGTALSGYIVERVSGTPFNAYIARHILEPLDMQQATFVQPLPADLADDMSGGYNYLNGKYIKGDFEYVVGTPAGALSASGLDMAKFMIAHLQNGQYGDTRILAEETAVQMHSPLYSPDPRVDGMAYGFFYNTINGQYTISHGGDTMLFHSQLYLLPETNTGIFVSTNGTTGAVVAEQVIEAFLDRYYPEPEQLELTPAAGFAERAAQYAGSYHLARNNFTTFEKILMLMTPINVWVEDERVFISFGGGVEQYVETEPGLLVNPQEPADRLVMEVVDGQVTLAPSLPFVFLKTPWYGAAGLHGLILLGGGLFFLVMLIVWPVNFFRGLKHGEKRPLGARLARLAAGLFGLVFLVFFGTLAGTFGNILPAYGVPAVFFTVSASLDRALTLLPVILAGLAGLVFIFAMLAWVKSYWKTGGRVVYTLLTLFALAMIWSFTYWNFL